MIRVRREYKKCNMISEYGNFASINFKCDYDDWYAVEA